MLHFILRVFLLVVITGILLNTVVVLVNISSSTLEETTHMSPTTRFPNHWLHYPYRQTKDHVILPRSYGTGSSTVRSWILHWMHLDSIFSPENQQRWHLRQTIPYILVHAAIVHHIHIFPSPIVAGSSVTTDFVDTRIRIPVDTHGNVTGNTVIQIG